MPIQLPSREELARLASGFELQLSEDEVGAFFALAEPTAAGYARLDELEDETLPVKYPRVDPGHRPSG
jgi:amidase